jgi:8-oxo-dGTP pyrophosphatase MutT (NUDIX family)
MRPSSKIVDYVVGFVFDQLAPSGHVVLIQKKRPAWQHGKLNGVGGHVEMGKETPLEAMRREFKEEANADIQTWTHFATLSERAPDADRVDRVFYFLSVVSSHESGLIRPSTDEWILWVTVSQLGEHPCLPSVKWLVPLAVNDDRRRWPWRFTASGVDQGIAKDLEP